MANDENDDVKDQPEGSASDDAAEGASAGSDAEAPSPDDATEDEATEDDATKDEATKDDEHDEPVAAAPAVVAAHAAHAHGHDAAAHGHGDDLAHVTPVRLLLAVWASLSVLTILTVSVTHWDFGGQTNLVVAMIIATMKASLVVVFFMHLRWDRRFHALVFLSSLLFVILFIGLALTDRAEYQPNIDAFEATQAQQTP